jgi:hypothetical protein
VTEFVPGDRVRCIDNGNSSIITAGDEYVISAVSHGEFTGREMVDLVGLNRLRFFASRFEKIIDPNRFNTGDRVMLTNGTGTRVGLGLGQVTELSRPPDEVRIRFDTGQHYWYGVVEANRRFEKIIDPPRKEGTVPAFNTGDRVRCVEANSSLELGREYTVSFCDGWFVSLVGDGERFSTHRFELIDQPTKEGTMSTNLTVGDRVRCIDNTHCSVLTDGQEYVISSVNVRDDDVFVCVEGVITEYFAHRFEKIEQVTIDPAELAALRERAGKLDGLCDRIRAAGKANNFEFCDSGLRAFCEQNGIEFTHEPVTRRAVLHMDLPDGTFAEQRDAMRALLDYVGGLGGVGWKKLTMDEESNHDGEDWSENPDDRLSHVVGL